MKDKLYYLYKCKEQWKYIQQTGGTKWDYEQFSGDPVTCYACEYVRDLQEHNHDGFQSDCSGLCPLDGYCWHGGCYENGPYRDMGKFSGYREQAVQGRKECATRMLVGINEAIDELTEEVEEKSYMRYINIYIILIVLLGIMIGSFGYVLPFFISAKSTLMVLGGVAYSFVIIPLVIWFVYQLGLAIDNL